MKSTEELRAELEQLKQKSALPALTADEEERAKLIAERATLKRKAEAKEMEAREARNDEIFMELESKHEVELHRIDTGSGDLIVMKAPTIAKSRQFQQVALKGKLSVDSLDEFVKPCIVYPTSDELERRLEKYPLLAATLCQFAQELGSDEAKRRTGK